MVIKWRNVRAGRSHKTCVMVHMRKWAQRANQAAQHRAATLGLQSQWCSLPKWFLAAPMMKALIPRRPLLDWGAVMKLDYSSRFWKLKVIAFVFTISPWFIWVHIVYRNLVSPMETTKKWWLPVSNPWEVCRTWETFCCSSCIAWGNQRNPKHQVSLGATLWCWNKYQRKMWLVKWQNSNLKVGRHIQI